MTDENKQSNQPQAITPDQLGRILEKGAESRRVMLLDRIDVSFSDTKPYDAKQKMQIGGIKTWARCFSQFVAGELPAGHYSEIALNKIEEAAMWAMKAVTFDYKPSEEKDEV